VQNLGVPEARMSQQPTTLIRGVLPLLLLPVLLTWRAALRTPADVPHVTV
jgi:hypothetical protein